MPTYNHRCLVATRFQVRTCRCKMQMAIMPPLQNRLKAGNPFINTPMLWHVWVCRLVSFILLLINLPSGQSGLKLGEVYARFNLKTLQSDCAVLICAFSCITRLKPSLTLIESYLHHRRCFGGTLSTVRWRNTGVSPPSGRGIGTIFCTIKFRCNVILNLSKGYGYIFG